MRKTALLSFLFVALGYLVFAQNTDSLALVNAQWKKQKIVAKTKLFTHHFNQKDLFLANQFISYIEIKRKGNAPIFAFGNEIKVKKTTSDFAKGLGAIAAINGTFFDVANGGSVDFIKMNGTVIKQNVLGKNGKRAKHQESAIVINDNGRLALRKWDGTPNWENNLTEKHVMVSGPLLIFNKKPEELDSSSFAK